VTLVGATKTVAPDLIRAAALLGLRDFGENYVQEAESKSAVLRADQQLRIRWHMIGHLQTNKVKAALEVFDIIQSVDSVHLAEAISRRATGKRVSVLLEVKFGEEPTRLGFRPGEIASVVPSIVRLPGLSVEGLMTVPPLDYSPDETRRTFCELRELRDRLVARFPEAPLHHLSMGMTGDYEAAIEEGATIVRVGRAIFGERPPRA
jgi:pyridoxal phosphate enzyme (YggS family)